MEKRTFYSVEGISVIFSKLTVNTFLKQLGQLGTFSLSPFPLILSGRDQQCLPLDKVRKTLSGGRIICYRKMRASLRITLPWKSWADLGGLLWNSITDTERRKKSIYLKTLMESTSNVGNRIGEVASPPDFFLSRMKCGSQNALPTSHRTQIRLPFGEGASWGSKIIQFRGHLSQLPRYQSTKLCHL